MQDSSINLFSNAEIGDKFILRNGSEVTYYGEECPQIYRVSDYLVLEDGRVFDPFMTGIIDSEFDVVAKA